MNEHSFYWDLFSGKHKCPKRWFEFQSQCFLIDKTARTWREAEHHCVSLGRNLESEHDSNCYSGHLASVHNPEEFQFLQALTQTVSLPLWIGGSAQDGRWSWSDSSKFNYKNWAKGKPENFDPARRPCIQMNYGEKHRWNDATCGMKFLSLCSLRTE
uniref:C-type lectin domain-containing protein n=1 Tax=Esox lucius TaxID=8010 RepID=A0A3P8ZR01_ESOLU